MFKLKSISGIVQRHLHLLEFIRDNGPQSKKEICEILEIHPNTFDGMIKQLLKSKWIKKLENGKFSYYDYTYLEKDIENLIRKEYRDHIPKKIDKKAVNNIANYFYLKPSNKEFQKALGKVLKKLDCRIFQ